MTHIHTHLQLNYTITLNNYNNNKKQKKNHCIQLLLPPNKWDQKKKKNQQKNTYEYTIPHETDASKLGWREAMEEQYLQQIFTPITYK